VFGIVLGLLEHAVNDRNA